VLSPLCALTLLNTINFSLYEIVCRSLNTISSNGNVDDVDNEDDDGDCDGDDKEDDDGDCDDNDL